MVLLYSIRISSIAANFLEVSLEVVDRARQQPHKRCHGAKMHYTPLVLNNGRDRPILGVCDSSCLPISSASRSSKLGISGSAAEALLLWSCDDTVTLPENDLDPELYARKFPFRARTCFVDKSLDGGLTAQVEFEKVGYDDALRLFPRSFLTPLVHPDLPQGSGSIHQSGIQDMASGLA